jgi:signal recognition particle subunit SRP19
MSGKGIVIWPTYLDKRVSRGRGRRIPRKIAVKSPKPDEIVKALRKLGLEVDVEPDKAYPKRWWDEKGRIIVKKVKSKDALLREVALTIKEMRG